MAAGKSGPPAKRGGATGVSRVSKRGGNKELDAIHDLLVESVRDSEKAAAKFWRGLEAAERMKLAEYKHYQATSDYLVGEFNYERRSAQHTVQTVKVWSDLGLPVDVVDELGPTVCREIASYLKRSGASKRTAMAFISKVRDTKMTSRQIQTYATDQLEDQDSADSKGQRRDREPRRAWNLSVTDTDKQEILESLVDLEQITGSPDAGENIKLAVVEMAQSRSENPEDAIEYASRQIGGIQKGLDQVVSSIMTLQGTGRKTDDRAADRLISQTTQVVIRGIAAVSGYLSPDAEIDPELAFKVATNGKKSLRDGQRHNFANTCLLLARICGAPKKLIGELDMALRPPEEP